MCSTRKSRTVRNKNSMARVLHTRETKTKAFLVFNDTLQAYSASDGQKRVRYFDVSMMFPVSGDTRLVACLKITCQISAGRAGSGGLALESLFPERRLLT